MAQWLSALAALAKDLNLVLWFSVPILAGSQLPVTPVLGDMMPYSGLYRHYMHVVQEQSSTHIQIKVNELFKNYF